jgi:hypothetical protein
MSRIGTHPATLLLLTLAVAQPAFLYGQETTAQVAVSGGVATDQYGTRSNALTLVPSAIFSGRRASMQLGGSATRFAGSTYSVGAGASAAAQETIGRFAAFSLTANGNTSRLSSTSTATFSSVDVMPAFELRARRVSLFGGLRAAAGTRAERTPSQGLALPGAGTRTSISRQGAGLAFGGVVSFGDESRTLRLTAREDRLRVDGVARPERSLGASLAFALTPATTLEVAGGRYDGNRLLGTPAGEYVNVGLALRLGGGLREPALPRAAGAQQPRGTTRLSIRAPQAQRVEIAGDFNDWKPLAAIRAANGVWYADLSIPPGQYRYAFRVNGKEWRVPDGATAVDDGFGGKSAWVTVSDAWPR